MMASQHDIDKLQEKFAAVKEIEQQVGEENAVEPAMIMETMGLTAAGKIQKKLTEAKMGHIWG